MRLRTLRRRVGRDDAVVRTAMPRQLVLINDSDLGLWRTTEPAGGRQPGRSHNALECPRFTRW